MTGGHEVSRQERRRLLQEKAKEKKRIDMLLRRRKGKRKIEILKHKRKLEGQNGD